MLLWLLPASVFGCGDDDGQPIGSSSGAGAGSGSSSDLPSAGSGAEAGAGGDTPGSSSNSASSSDDGGPSSPTADGDDSSSATSESGGAAGPFASVRFTIPAGTVVEEFSFDADADAVPGALDGRTLWVSVVDVSHPRREQSELCPGSHPLDGCATVDYGAFGMTHDNRVTLEGVDGPLSVHLYKDRSLQREPEPLPASE